jgi:hypothetical protein
MLADMFPADPGQIEREVFPGLDMGDKLTLI